MKEYELFYLNSDINKSIVLITNTEDFYYVKDSIYDELSEIYGESFTVLVDLLLRNGFSFNRYLSINYKNKNDYKSLIINPREVEEEIKFKINKYLKENIIFLEESALSQNIKNYIKSSI